MPGHPALKRIGIISRRSHLIDCRPRHPILNCCLLGSDGLRDAGHVGGEREGGTGSERTQQHAVVRSVVEARDTVPAPPFRSPSSRRWTPKTVASTLEAAS